jgi:hypothetical protein
MPKVPRSQTSLYGLPRVSGPTAISGYHRPPISSAMPIIPQPTPIRKPASARNYAEAREYLGEDYVVLGKLDLAKQQLAEIKRIYGISCEEYAELNEAIEEAVKAATANQKSTIKILLMNGRLVDWH